MYIHKKIFSILLIFFSFITLSNVVIAPTAFLEVEFNKDNKTKLLDFYYTNQNYDYLFSGKGFGNYSVEILDKSGNILYSEKFGDVNFYIQIITETGVITQEINSTSKNFRLFLPEKSYFINFYKEDEKILAISIPDYLCNKNGKCDTDKGETEYLCPNECGAKPTTTTLPSKQPTVSYYYVLIIVAIVVVVILLMIKRVKVEKSESTI